MVAPPGGFFTFMKILPNVSFISMVIKKSVFVSINSHNLNFSTEMHSLKVWLWNISTKNRSVWLVSKVCIWAAFLNNRVDITEASSSKFPIWICSFGVSGIHIRKIFFNFDTLSYFWGYTRSSHIAIFGTGKQSHLLNFALREYSLSRVYVHCKGQIISECPYEIIVSPKIPTKKIPRFLP